MPHARVRTAIEGQATARGSRTGARRALLVFLTVTALFVPVAAAAADDAAVPPLIDQPLADANSAAEAAQMAATTDQPVMVNDDTTPTSAVFVNPDGSRSVEITGDSSRISDPNDPSGWVDVDMTLMRDASGIHPRHSPTPMTLSDGGNDGYLTKLGVDGDLFTMSWLSSLPIPVLKGSRARYEDAVTGGVDLIVEARTSGFELSYQVPHKPLGPLVLRIPLTLRGLTAALTADDLLELHDAVTGEVKAQATPVLLWGTARNPANDEPIDQDQADLQLTTDASGQIWLEARPDPAFFDRPGLTYPVTIDPPVSVNQHADTFISPAFPDTNFGNNVELQVGSPGGVTNDYRRALLGFETNNLPNGVMIEKDTYLKLWQTTAGNCTSPIAMELWSVNAMPQIATTWNTRPGLPAKYATVTAGHGSTCSGGAGWTQIQKLSGQDVDGYKGTQLATLVQAWVNTSPPPRGLALRAATETTTAGWRKFISANGAAAQQWVLHVSYNTRPAVPVPTVTGGARVATSAVDFHATVNDADPGDAICAIYQIYNTVSGALVTTVVGATTTPGGDSPATVTLADGSYTVRAAASNGRYDWNKVSDWSAFGAAVAFNVEGGVVMNLLDNGGADDSPAEDVNPTTKAVKVSPGDSVQASPPSSASLSASPASLVTTAANSLGIKAHSLGAGVPAQEVTAGTFAFLPSGSALTYVYRPRPYDSGGFAGLDTYVATTASGTLTQQFDLTSPSIPVMLNAAGDQDFNLIGGDDVTLVGGVGVSAWDDTGANVPVTTSVSGMNLTVSATRPAGATSVTIGVSLVDSGDPASDTVDDDDETVDTLARPVDPPANPSCPRPSPDATIWACSAGPHADANNLGVTGNLRGCSSTDQELHVPNDADQEVLPDPLRLAGSAV